MKTIVIDGIASTISVMEYVCDHQDDATGTLYFKFWNNNVLLCSPESEPHMSSIADFIAQHPFSEWAKIDSNMYRYFLGNGAWYAYINDKMYFISE